MTGLSFTSGVGCVSMVSRALAGCFGVPRVFCSRFAMGVSGDAGLMRVECVRMFLAMGGYDGCF